MSGEPIESASNLPDATAQVAQEHLAVRPLDPAAPSEDPGFACNIGAGVERAARVRPYQRRSGDPIYRPLRIYAIDPAQSRFEGALAIVKVPYEPLAPGPVGCLFEVDDHDRERKVRYGRVDLEAQANLINSGRDPSPSDPQFHQQMVYAVCSSVYAAFGAALGRDPAWGHGERPGVNQVPTNPRDPTFPLRLRLVPHAMREQNAYYDPGSGELRFGYDRASANIGAANPPGGYVFSCLSHDIIAHELSHALLHGLREQFAIPTRRDVLAFHEAFGDLVAIFQHFAYSEVVAAAIAQSGGELLRAQMLAELARQFGYTKRCDGPSGAAAPGAAVPPGKALRSAIDIVGPDERPQRQYDPRLEVHELGSVLVSAVFEAFTTLFRRKTARYVRLATNGRGVLEPGALPNDLQHVLADEASQLASQILGLCIRAVDYCPPVDLEFGDYLRAMITADSELIPDDRWAYREALVTAFGRRGIFPSGVGNLSESSLRWSPPWFPIQIPDLHLARLGLSGDPARSSDAEALRKQAEALGGVVTRPECSDAFGLARPDGRDVSIPVVRSIRSARRVGPDGQVQFDLVAEVTQDRRLPATGGRPPATLYGGATVIVDPEGFVRYAIVKNINNRRRMDDCQSFLDPSHDASVFTLWEAAGGGGNEGLRPKADLFRLTHQPAESV